jgi:hypothetical protein
MSELRDRAQLIPELELRPGAEVVAEGRAMARKITPGRCAFLDHYGVETEAEYKRRCVAEGRIMLHAAIGYRDPFRTARACADIWETLDKKGYRLDRFGLVFDRNMGYPPEMRADMPVGTGLINHCDEAWAAIAAAAPTAPYYGDFMIGQPASFENAAMAIQTGATMMGNLSHFYNYKLLYMEDDAGRAASTVKAIALLAAQPKEMYVGSNADDGFGPLFTDLACTFGLVLFEKYLVETLIGARHATVFGNMFADPRTRMAFQRALALVGEETGPMVYGATTLYGPDLDANYASLAHYVTFDIATLRDRPTGHALTPIPVTEYARIPDPDEIVEAHIVANRLIELAPSVETLIDFAVIDRIAMDLVAGGERFRDNLLKGFAEAGIDISDPIELLLAVKRAGARNLERWYGPGKEDPATARGRRPVVLVENIAELEAKGDAILGAIPAGKVKAIGGRGYIACVATTDVHEYGKLLLEHVMRGLDVDTVDGGVSADPARLVDKAAESGADFIALSTYNGIALSYLTKLREAMEAAGLNIPIYIGGRLNQVPKSSNTSLPVDVSAGLVESGAIVCSDVEAMLDRLAGDAEPTVAASTDKGA